jgi:nucleoside-diphosphate-sugar epimerase
VNSVLITGASGFIGRHTLSRLSELGYDIHAVCSREPVPSGPKVNWHTVDLLDFTSTARLLKTVRPSHLLHLAWYAIPGKYPTSIENVRWCEATLALLRLFSECGGQRAVFAGSCFEYDVAYGFCSEEITPCNPATLYGVCKNATRQVILSSAARFSVSAAWARIFYLYGPFEAESRLVPSVIISLLRGQPARCSSGRQLRDYSHVQDVADSFAAVLDSGYEGTINLGSGQAVSIRSIVAEIARQLESENRVEFGAIQSSVSEPPLIVADVRNLREKVQFEPAISLSDGVRQTVGWWREHTLQ